ncbi:polysaccharide biosynthesis protein [Lachnospiraceae bacterium AM25-11LB]|nr:polysaccharide biosynthesis protein [Lachnospiraceae bacterium AM25-22]RGD07529.1 polysaccharide biosynthesis protein [Lachnospiraceae bacterium AM25-11LB]RJW09753.1 polysaccharide biosynthesis protein [Lachnospiraceae bacterium AM25-40]RJW14221.1 polysaccharide biosynthesis protein [Lachnospiraceae bacterium AM25-39]
MTKNIKMTKNIRWMLIFYDMGVYAIAAFLLLAFYAGDDKLSGKGIFEQAVISIICIFAARIIGNIYGQVWRYGGIQCYIRLLFTDFAGFLAYLCLESILPIQHITFGRLLSLVSLNLLGALAIRMVYRYAYKCGNHDTLKGKILLVLFRIFSGMEVGNDNDIQKIKIAIIGAGRVGVGLAEELLNNSEASYTPRCFIDVNKEKVGREIQGIPVWSEDEATLRKLDELEVQEIVFAIPSMDAQKKKELYEYYTEAGYKLKVYDFPTVYAVGGKRHLREFDAEELLFRKPLAVADERTNAYYKNKVVLITGGGGSIGSELCRQLAKMAPKQLIILDIYENGAYDVQQELKIAYGDNLNLQVEIASITNRKAMERVFETYHPQIVINAAAHKHVPLMEHNCIEAIENNIFGTKVVVELCEEYGAERFMMVSTDKAVNPTNVMGATKRMCEMIAQSASTHGKVKYSITRFGNVLGSAGSVIPLFKRQIANGGPVTITDKRIIRYFMTIPEASQLVLQSGAIANNGELFVLDMGKPVKIMDLAENMIRLSGVHGVEIVETGLRPGEKLYEELLVKTEELDKTSNSMIFIERDKPLSAEEIDARLDALKKACETGDDLEAKEALRNAVPTFKRPEEVNKGIK